AAPHRPVALAADPVGGRAILLAGLAVASAALDVVGAGEVALPEPEGVGGGAVVEQAPVEAVPGVVADPVVAAADRRTRLEVEVAALHADPSVQIADRTAQGAVAVLDAGAEVQAVLRVGDALS